MMTLQTVHNTLFLSLGIYTYTVHIYRSLTYMNHEYMNRINMNHIYIYMHHIYIYHYQSINLITIISFQLTISKLRFHSYLNKFLIKYSRSTIIIIIIARHIIMRKQELQFITHILKSRQFIDSTVFEAVVVLSIHLISHQSINRSIYQIIHLVALILS